VPAAAPAAARAGEPPRRPPAGRPPAEGFTLIEVLVAMAVLITVMAIVVGAFHAVLGGWERGRRTLDGLRRGEYVMEQTVDALHSATSFGAARKANVYSFDVGSAAANAAGGSLSWVTTSSAFLPPRSWLENVPHRLLLSIEPQASGEPALVARAWPYLADTNLVDWTPGFVAPAISGLACQIYNYDSREWDDTWGNSNNLPAQVQITLYVKVEDRTEPMVLQRLVEIPLGVTNAQQSASIDNFPAPAASGSSLGSAVGGGGGGGGASGKGGKGGGAHTTGPGAGAPGGGGLPAPPGGRRK